MKTFKTEYWNQATIHEIINVKAVIVKRAKREGEDVQKAIAYFYKN